MLKAAQQAIDSAKELAERVQLVERHNGNRVEIPAVALRATYAIVVTPTAPVGLPLMMKDLVAAKLMPDPVQVLWIAADSLILFEHHFPTPQEFVAYIDFRLSLQRRPWMFLADEDEAAGFSFTQTSSAWLRRNDPLP